MAFHTGFNDAYETVGWTAQNMAYPAPGTNILNLPVDIETVTISGHFRDGDGGMANGWFEIDNGKTVLRHTSTKEIITPIKIRAEIRDGVFSVSVPATDATTVTSAPSPWYYHVRIALAGKPFEELWNVHLPLASAVADVFDISGDSLPSPDAPAVVIDGGTP